jgi:GT2 family glycosyltransferase
MEADRGVADIVICVHDAVDDVRRCLAAIAVHTAPRHRVILVDDASGAACRATLDRFTAARPGTTLLRNATRLGYTRSANRGLRASSAAFVVLLNSDTIVTPGWLERMLECAASDAAIGIVGPLSNAATWQSVPQCYDGDGNWALNPLPAGWGPDEVAALIDGLAPRAFPRVGFVNGFCFGLTRALIAAIGYFDEDAFPDAYGEEQDYCLRAAEAGFALTIAEHAYVYHAWSRSYHAEQVETLKDAGFAALLRRHGEARIGDAAAMSYMNPTLEAMREAVGEVLGETTPFRGTSAQVPLAAPPMSATAG